MAVVSIIYAPNPIFKKVCEPVAAVNDEVKQMAQDMLDTLQFEQAVGLGANMLGFTKRIAVVDLNENNISKPYVFINPEIIYQSDETQTFEEASLSYPGISAQITRPKAITVRYLDMEGTERELEAEGFFATVIQHEVDYLNGKVFLDHLSKLKSDMLLKKMQKFMKMNPPHIHTEHCNH
jgi:peptide deformylase